MNQKASLLTISFLVLAALVIFSYIYIFSETLGFYSGMFISFCSQVLGSLRNHLHFDKEGLVFATIILTVLISASLVILEILKFVIASNNLVRKSRELSSYPQVLSELIKKHHWEKLSFALSNESKLLAYTVGLLKPRIVLSESLINQVSSQQLEAIILHEVYHLKSKHVLWSFLMRLVSAFLFFIPLFNYLTKQLKTQFELSADAFVVKQQQTKKHLCSSLVFNLERSNLPAVGFAELEIEKRVELLFSNRVSLDRLSFKQLSLSFLSLSLMIAFLVFSRPAKIEANFSPVKSNCNSFETTEMELPMSRVPMSF